MACIGREIVQSRIWIDDKLKTDPSLNHKETFPITVFDAVRLSMDDENSQTLTEVISNIRSELSTKQTKIPARASNYLVTYAGYVGQVGAIQMTQSIPWNADEWSSSKIPTEKAIGDFIMKLGFNMDDGCNCDDTTPALPNTPNTSTSKVVKWTDIFGRPILYSTLGYNEDGVVLQKPITEAFDSLNDTIVDIQNRIESLSNIDDLRFNNHINDFNNPHRVTLDQIGAVSTDAFEFHINEAINPHHITKEMLGLENVNNTSDADKPISNATQEALDALRKLISAISNDAGDFNFITNIEYDQESGRLIGYFKNGSTTVQNIPINGLVDDIKFDPDTNEFTIVDLGGFTRKISIDHLFSRYLGSESANITVDIQHDGIDSHIWNVSATINPKGITDIEMNDNSVVERTIADSSVTTDKIKDLTITTAKYADGSITTGKISDKAITNDKLGDRSITGRNLFTSSTNNRVLTITKAGESPQWTQITADMIEEDAITTRHITRNSITVDLLQQDIDINSVVKNHSITIEKLNIDNSITNEMIVNNTITGDKLEPDMEFPGTPSIETPPGENSNDKSIPSTRWVRETIENHVFNNSNIGSESITGDKLFKSNGSDKVLVTYHIGTDPVWGTINNNMLDDSCILTSNIADDAVTGSKIRANSILSTHINRASILAEHITDNAVTLEKIEPSNAANRVLASLKENGNPQYTKVTKDMIESNSIGTDHIEDHSITPSKLLYSEESNRVLGVGLKHSDPQWMQINNGMISSRAVDGRTLFSTANHNMILGVTTPDTDPAWLKVNSGMIDEKVVKREHIADGAIYSEHISEKTIESKHIMDWTIQSNNIAPNAITGVELFTSPVPNRVLAVTTMPYSNPAWLQVTTDMIEDCAVSRDKIFQSAHPYRVLGASQAGVPPEYIMIDSNYVVDFSITGGKLIRNIIFHGTPSMTIHPDAGSSDYTIPSTLWVRNTVASMLNDFDSDILLNVVGSDTMKQLIKEAISNHSIDGTKLFTSKYDGPRVLGVTEKGADAEYILITTELISDGSITTNKLQRDIHLLGSPVVEIRPEPQASDGNGSGHQIPDCQWVLDRINDAGGVTGGGSSSGSGASLSNGSVITDYIKDRAVTGAKLFTSSVANRILGVIGANTNPQWTQINNSMIGDKAVNGRNLFSSTENNRLLGVIKAGDSPSYIKLTSDMIGDNVIRTINYIDKSVTGEKIADYVITSDKFVKEPIVDTIHLFDNAVNHEKIAPNAVVTDKIENNAVTGEKIAANVELSGTPTVNHTSTYKNKSLRNITISTEAPSGGSDGDIWFQYV